MKGVDENSFFFGSNHLLKRGENKNGCLEKNENRPCDSVALRVTTLGGNAEEMSFPTRRGRPSGPCISARRFARVCALWVLRPMWI